METRFGADFSSVRVHTDSNAVQMNKELGAQAFTHGNDRDVMPSPIAILSKSWFWRFNPVALSLKRVSRQR
ncbi:eCIS core domain-containing protein [Scytonema sp. NUACC21]